MYECRMVMACIRNALFADLQGTCAYTSACVCLLSQMCVIVMCLRQGNICPPTALAETCGWMSEVRPKIPARRAERRKWKRYAEVVRICDRKTR